MTTETCENNGNPVHREDDPVLEIGNLGFFDDQAVEEMDDDEKVEEKKVKKAEDNKKEVAGNDGSADKVVLGFSDVSKFDKTPPKPSNSSEAIVNSSQSVQPEQQSTQRMAGGIKHPVERFLKPEEPPAAKQAVTKKPVKKQPVPKQPVAQKLTAEDIFGAPDDMMKFAIGRPTTNPPTAEQPTPGMHYRIYGYAAGSDIAKIALAGCKNLKGQLYLKSKREETNCLPPNVVHLPLETCNREDPEIKGLLRIAKDVIIRLGLSQSKKFTTAFNENFFLAFCPSNDPYEKSFKRCHPRNPFVDPPIYEEMFEDRLTDSEEMIRRVFERRSKYNNLNQSMTYEGLKYCDDIYWSHHIEPFPPALEGKVPPRPSDFEEIKQMQLAAILLLNPDFSETLIDDTNKILQKQEEMRAREQAAAAAANRRQ